MAGMTNTNTRYRAELLGNGLIRVFDYACNWATCYTVRQDGRVAYAHGQGSQDNHEARMCAQVLADTLTMTRTPCFPHEAR